MKFRLSVAVPLALVLPLAACSHSCGEDDSPELAQLRVASWNVQTFFDAVTDGCEYDDFIKSDDWGEAAYTARLERLAAVVKALDADVVALEEVENEGVMHDVENFLAGEWDSRKVYSYACFAKDAGGAIGCGVLSRWPLEDVTVHALDVRTAGEAMPSMRPLLEVAVCRDSRRLVLMVNHWKSMSGGEAATEKWRLMQEDLLARRMAACVARGQAVLACGDFNRDVQAFCAGNSPQEVVLRMEDADGLGGGGVTVVTPWYDGGWVEPGSYYYNGGWSRLDSFFAAGDVVVEGFAPQTDGPWCNEDTLVPWRYRLWTGGGYSDHLPVMGTVWF